MAKTENGINIVTDLEIGSDELQWLQAEIVERAAFLRCANMARPGWFGNRRSSGSGAPRYGWSVVEDGTTGALLLQTVTGTIEVGPGWQFGAHRAPQRRGGVFPDGRPAELPNGDQIPLLTPSGAAVVIPDDGVWYTLVAVYASELYEPGEITLTQNSATVSGTRTGFTRYTDATGPVATQIRIDAADTANGHEGIYTVVAITDDDTMTISPTPTQATETVRFRVRGRFFAAPTGEEDAHRNVRVAWEVRARVSTPLSDALVAYDVRRDTGVSPNVAMYDRRLGNEYLPMTDARDAGSVRVRPRFRIAGSAQSVLLDEYNLAAGGLPNLLGADLAPAAVSRDSGTGTDYSGLLLAHYDNTGITFRRERSSSYLVLGSTVDGTGSIVQAGITGLSLEQIPAASGFTHAVAYSTDVILVAKSTNNGTAWSTPATVWDPTTIDVNDTVQYPALLFTSFGRLILAAVYFDDSAANYDIRYVYSDDLGETWVTNANAGFTAVSACVVPRNVELVEDGYGVIHGLYVEEAASDLLWTWRGTAPNDPTIDNDRARTLNRGTQMATAAALFGGDTFGQPRAIGFADGTVCVAVAQQTLADVSANLLTLHWKEDELFEVRRLWTNAIDASLVDTQRGIALAEQTNTGDVRLAYYSTATNAIRGIYCDAVQIGQSVQWPGGR